MAKAGAKAQTTAKAKTRPGAKASARTTAAARPRAKPKAGVRVCIIGMGLSGAGAHAECLARSRKFELVAVADNSESLLAKARGKFKAPGYSSLEELLARVEAELVVIATPTVFHAEQAVMALRAGRHVVVEAPMCMTVREADSMITAARQYRRVLAVCHSHRWDGDFLALRRAVEGDKLGTVFSIQRHQRVPGAAWAASAAGDSKSSWRLQRAYGGGIGYEWGYHLIDQTLRLVPSEPEVIFGDAQAREVASEVDDHFTCVIRFRNRALAMIEASACVREPAAGWLVMGTKGMVQGDHKRLRGKVGSGARQKDLVLRVVNGGLADFYDNLHQALTTGAELETTLAQARQTVLVVEAGYRSSRIGCAVRLTGLE